MRTYYVLKVEGKAKVPDYIQVRDDSFTLIGYFRPGRNTHDRRGGKHSELFRLIEQQADSLPFGKITSIVVDTPTANE
jgi:hypothetical protein